jgi:hypothetical protein
MCAPAKCVTHPRNVIIEVCRREFHRKLLPKQIPSRSRTHPIQYMRQLGCTKCLHSKQQVAISVFAKIIPKSICDSLGIYTHILSRAHNQERMERLITRGAEPAAAGWQSIQSLKIKLKPQVVTTLGLSEHRSVLRVLSRRMCAGYSIPYLMFNMAELIYSLFGCVFRQPFEDESRIRSALLTFQLLPWKLNQV